MCCVWIEGCQGVLHLPAALGFLVAEEGGDTLADRGAAVGLAGAEPALGLAAPATCRDGVSMRLYVLKLLGQRSGRPPSPDSLLCGPLPSAILYLQDPPAVACLPL